MPDSDGKFPNSAHPPNTECQLGERSRTPEADTASLVLNVILSSLVFYAIVTQTIYCIWLHRQHSRRLKAPDVSCVVATFVVLLRVSFPFVYAMEKASDYATIRSTIQYKIVTFELVSTSIWITLWLRQRILYSEPLVREVIKSKVLLFISNAIPFMIVAISIIAITFMLISGQGFPPAWVTLYVLNVSTELALLFLFVYPLLKHIRSPVMDENTFAFEAQKSAIRVACVMTGVCLAMHMTSMIVKFTLSDAWEGTEVYFAITNDLTCTVEIFAVILSFTNWRDKLFPWKLNWNRNSSSSEMSQELA